MSVWGLHIRWQIIQNVLLYRFRPFQMLLPVIMFHIKQKQIHTGNGFLHLFLSCVNACLGNGEKALTMEGQRMTAGEVLKEVLKDEVFYKSSGGGVTFSGGGIPDWHTSGILKGIPSGTRWFEYPVRREYRISEC